MAAGCLLGQAPQGNAFFAGPGTRGATLNGAALLPGTSILAGETVYTGPGGVAILAPTHGAGGVLELGSNGSATVHSGPVIAGLGTDQLEMKQGNALVVGNVSVATPQGETFRPAEAGTSYIVNAGTNVSTMGVVRGAVNTFGPRIAATVIPAGDAVQVSGAGGVVQLSSIKMAQVVKPQAAAAVPQTTVASVSR